MKKMQYKIKILTKVTEQAGGLRNFGPTHLAFDFDDDPACVNESDESAPSGFAYKALVQMLANSISEISRMAADNGISEGVVIRDAIETLEQNLIDSDRKPAQLLK